MLSEREEHNFHSLSHNLCVISAVIGVWVNLKLSLPFFSRYISFPMSSVLNIIICVSAAVSSVGP